VTKRIVVIGGGLVGLGTAWALVRRHPRAEVTVLEKESAPGQHQSTHNSGVLHCGLYYTPGSARARLAVRGIRQMTAFCREHGIAHETCGKLVVAVSSDEIPRLKALFERGQANGLQGLRWLGPEEARGIEPHVNAKAAVHVPEEGIVDYAAVVRTLTGKILESGGEVHCSSRVMQLGRHPDGWTITTPRAELHADFLVNCAGLHADRVAALAGEPRDVRIIPFRGEYWELRPGRTHLVNHLVYPVPDPALPFLGVHYTRMIHGGVECGPNAVLALKREGYRWGDVDAGELADALSFAGLWRFIARFPRTTALEVARSLSKRRFAANLRRLVPELREDDLVPGMRGVRAMAMRRDGRFVEDFHFVERPDALHVLSAPSPAATASLAIGEEIANKVAP
jgi:L-2-hydroxyglutarate oxidase